MFGRLLKPRAKAPPRRTPAAKSPARTPPRPQVRALAVDGVPAPLELRLSPRARRLSLRVDAARELVQVVAPAGVGDAEIARFVGRHLDWVRGRLAAIPPRLPFADGALVPILGVPHRIRHDPGHRGAPRPLAGPEGPELRVGGGAEFLSRRVREWLKAEARRRLAERARAKAAGLGATVTAVSVRDTRSRWGSCSAGGRLSFSWRLILAPEPVFDYVVAHEVAHLREMNHSARFWALCASLTAEVDGPRAWLKAHGAGLHRYG
ncbi:M48 family metallopeptidase [Rhodospirillum centenum]|uniref:YgjP-like metallopeptidase domain-containing protein n=1 Tax=Rhodospirillum centenum (strain ATCC 51521 / SW) TaxID=414684 RepID=B6IWR9_RHOCS|nr:SprT family zinc-dependent metalloprotease [Rhodospirillum centenum]ACJ00743.1 conserved hypothetical protein [Rhodospirillum centenum SW]